MFVEAATHNDVVNFTYDGFPHTLVPESSVGWCDLIFWGIFRLVIRSAFGNATATYIYS